MEPYWSTNFLLLSPPRSVAFDLSGVFFKSRTEINDIRLAWNTFENIAISNINVTAGIANGSISLVKSDAVNDPLYHSFKGMAERNLFLRGQILHTERYPFINFSSIGSR
jgi:hypothetical protein